MSGRIQKLKVMAEYKSTGLFVIEPRNLIGEISHNRLGLTDDLSNKLYQWIERYNKWLNWDNPGEDVDIPQSEITEFNAKGRQLSREVQSQLPDVSVIYQPVYS